MSASLDSERTRLIDALEKIRNAIPRIAAVDLGYPSGESIVRPPSKTVDLSSRLSPDFPDRGPLLAFYELCDGISLPDLHNGIFIHSSKLILAAVERRVPLKLRSGGAIMVFGADGGGGMYCASSDHGQSVIYLPAGAVVDGEFDDMRTTTRKVAESFYEFLELVLADIDAFLENRQGWKYLT